MRWHDSPAARTLGCGEEEASQPSCAAVPAQSVHRPPVRLDVEPQHNRCRRGIAAAHAKAHDAAQVVGRTKVIGHADLVRQKESCTVEPEHCTRLRRQQRLLAEECVEGSVKAPQQEAAAPKQEAQQEPIECGEDAAHADLRVCAFLLSSIISSLLIIVPKGSSKAITHTDWTKARMAAPSQAENQGGGPGWLAALFGGSPQPAASESPRPKPASEDAGAVSWLHSPPSDRGTSPPTSEAELRSEEGNSDFSITEEAAESCDRRASGAVQYPQRAWAEREPLAPLRGPPQQARHASPSPAATPRFASPGVGGGRTAVATGRSKRMNTPPRRSAPPSSPAAPPTAAQATHARGFGMSTPRFDARYDAGAKAAAAQQQQQQLTRAQQRPVASEMQRQADAQRARGLHAAYAQCAALRRMLTALRVNRVLMRWRIAVVFLAAREEIEQAAVTREAMEEAVVEVHKRGEASAERAALVAYQRAYLSAMLPRMHGLPRLSAGFAQWVHAVGLLAADEATEAASRAHEEAADWCETLRTELTQRSAELEKTRRMIQKPTQLERLLGEATAERDAANAGLAACQKKLHAQQQRAERAEDRVKNMQREVSGARRKAASGGAGGGGTERERAAAESEADGLRNSLSAAVAEKLALDAKLDGQRAKVALLLDGRKRACASRLTSLLLLRAHSLLGPAIRRWQATSLATAPAAIEDGGGPAMAGGGHTLAASAPGGGGGAGPSEARQSRIIALQRELLDREAQLGAAHQAALAWRDERSALQQQLTQARADASAARGKVADAALAASAVAEREKHGAIESREKTIRGLRAQLGEASKGWKETSDALAASEAMLASAHADKGRLEKQLDDARRAAQAARIAKDEMSEARQSEAEGAARQIASLESQISLHAETAANATRDRPITLQREVTQLRREAETLRSQLNETTKKLTLQQKRTADAEGRMESLQREVATYREKQTSRLHRALMPSPRPAAGTASGGGGGGGGGGALSPRVAGGGFGPASPRVAARGADAPRRGPSHAAAPGSRMERDARVMRAPPPRPPTMAAGSAPPSALEPAYAPGALVAAPAEDPRGYAAPQLWQGAADEAPSVAIPALALPPHWHCTARS